MFSKTEAIKFGWEKMKKNFWVLTLMLIAYFVIQNLPALFGEINGNNRDFSVSFIAVVFYILVWILKMIMDLGIVQLVLNINDGKDAKFSDLFSKSQEYKLIWRYFLASLVYFLAVLGGFILFVVPGIIISIRLQFFNYLLVDKNLGPLEAIKRSWKMTKGVGWQLFLFGLLLALVNIAGALVFLVGLFATIPTSMIAQGYVYRKLLK